MPAYNTAPWPPLGAILIAFKQGVRRSTVMFTINGKVMIDLNVGLLYDIAG